MLVPSASLAASGDADRVAGSDQVAKEHAGRLVTDNRAGRNFQEQVRSAASVLVLAFASLAVFGRADWFRPEVQQCHQVGVGPQMDGAAVAAVAAVGAAAGDVLLPAEADAAVAPFAASHVQCRFIYEHAGRRRIRHRTEVS